MSTETEDVYDPSVSGSMPHSDVVIGAHLDHSGDVEIIAPFGKATETAKALLDAAEELGYDVSVVRTSDGNFHVPPDVADAADLPEDDIEVDPVTGAAADGGQKRDEKPAPRKAPARKAPAKRAPRKAAAK